MINGKEFIISLTTWRGRIQGVHKTLNSLLAQFVKADRIVLNIAYDEFPNKEDIPADLKRLVDSKKVELYYVRNNIKAFKKIIPTLLRYKNAYVISADDDIVYPVDWTKKHIDMLKNKSLATPTTCNEVFYFNASGGHGSIFQFSDIANTYHLFEDSALFACNQDDLIYGLMVSANRRNFTHFKYQVPNAYAVKGVSTGIDHDRNVRFVNKYLNDRYGVSLTDLRTHNFSSLQAKPSDTVANFFTSYTYEEVKNVPDMKDIIERGCDKFNNKLKINNVKAVYTLVSSQKDDYLEQLLLSIYSLKKHNDIDVKVLIDKNTSDSLVNGREELLKVADVQVINVPNDFTAVERSRYLKTHCREYVSGDMLFIDTDTLVVNNLGSLESLTGNIYICSENAQFKVIDAIYKTLKLIGCKNKYPYYNSGVIYCKDNEKTREFYRKWYEYWLVTKKKTKSHRDQYPLALLNDQLNMIQELDRDYNCMIQFTKPDTAKIIHYWANTNKYGKTIFKAIRDRKYKVNDSDYVLLKKDCERAKKVMSLRTTRQMAGDAFYLY